MSTKLLQTTYAFIIFASQTEEASHAHCWVNTIKQKGTIIDTQPLKKALHIEQKLRPHPVMG